MEYGGKALSQLHMMVDSEAKETVGPKAMVAPTVQSMFRACLRENVVMVTPMILLDLSNWTDHMTRMILLQITYGLQHQCLRIVPSRMLFIT